MPDDSAILRLTTALGRGDNAAFAAFYESWFDRGYDAVRAATGRDDAFCLDVVHDAMLRVVKSLRPMNTRADLDRWMTRVLHTTALDRLRREARMIARQRRHGEHTSGVANADNGADPPNAAALADQIAWLTVQVAAMDEQDRALLSLRFALDHSLNGAGKALGITGDAAHGRIRRVLVHLRSLAAAVTTRQGPLL